MRIRPYIESKDYEYIEKWISNERIHALWCANLIPYPLTKEKLYSFLKKNEIDWMDSAYVATESNGDIIGFFCYSVNVDDNTGFLKCIIIDSNQRGTGRGKEMIQLALQYAFNITDVDLVKLNVFKENTIAKHCYEKLGFVVESISKNVFPYKDELWSRCHMIIQNINSVSGKFL